MPATLHSSFNALRARIESCQRHGGYLLACARTLAHDMPETTWTDIKHVLDSMVWYGGYGTAAVKAAFDAGRAVQIAAEAERERDCAHYLRSIPRPADPYERD